MKNLTLLPILLPTEEASQLYITDKLYFDSRVVASLPNAKNQHLFLVSNAEINEGNWATDGLHVGKVKSTPSERSRKELEMSDDEVFIESIGFIKKSELKKIEFTTDPKLISGGVAAIDGKTKAFVEKYNSFAEEMNDVEVNFLEEFCKRYNQKDNQKVDVERLADEQLGSGYKNYDLVRTSWIAGFNYSQAIQSNAGRFSLEQVRQFIREYSRDNDAQLVSSKRVTIEPNQWCDKNIQSLTKEIPKGDIVIECEMEEKCLCKTTNDKFNCSFISVTKLAPKCSRTQIKLTNGQPIIHFK